MTRRVTIDEIFEALGALRANPECADLLQFRSLVTAHQYRPLIRLVQRFVTPASRVLDWGCGNGHFSYTLQKLGYRTSGYSFEDFGLRTHLGETYSFILGGTHGPTALPYEDDCFDAVVSVGVLEHVPETGGTESGSLREIRRILRPGGRFICFHFPNRYSWIEAISRRIPGKHRHPHRYTAGDIRRLCDAARLDCLTIQRYGALPRNLWHRAPATLRSARPVARAWDALDDLFARALSPVCQNYAFVAEASAKTARQR